MQCGLAQSVLVIGGLVIAEILLMVGAVYAMSALAAQMGQGFLALRIACALYLIYLGHQTLQDAASPFRFRRDLKPYQPGSLLSLFFGIRVTLGNPRIAAFYLAFMPAFIKPGSFAAADLAIAGSIIAVVTFAVLGLYALRASEATRVATQPEDRDSIQRKPSMLLFGPPFEVPAKMR